MLHRISAGAVVEVAGRVLLVRHQRPGRYDFWVAPGGGVQGNEALADTAVREVREESGLEIVALKLVYVEELIDPECRYVKFWFHAKHVGGQLDTSHPEASAEHITQAAWLSRSEMEGKTVFPPVLAERYWRDSEQGFPEVTHLPLRHMEFW